MEKNVIVRLNPSARNLLLCFVIKNHYSFSAIREKYDYEYPLECRKIIDRALGQTRTIEFGEALLNLLQSGCVYRIKSGYRISHVGINYLL